MLSLLKLAHDFTDNFTSASFNVNAPFHCDKVITTVEFDCQLESVTLKYMTKNLINSAFILIHLIIPFIQGRIHPLKIYLIRVTMYKILSCNAFY